MKKFESQLDYRPDGLGAVPYHTHNGIDSPALPYFMPLSMSQEQRDKIISPPKGMIIFNDTTNKLNIFTTSWEEITSA